MTDAEKVQLLEKRVDLLEAAVITFAEMAGVRPFGGDPRLRDCHNRLFPLMQFYSVGPGAVRGRRREEHPHFQEQYTQAAERLLELFETTF